MNEQSGRRILRWALVGLAAMIIVIAGVVLFAGDPETSKNPEQQAASGPEEVANSFMKSTVTLDESASYSLMTERLQKQLISQVRWSRYIESRFAGQKETVILSETRELQTKDRPKPRQLIYNVEITNEIAERVTLVLRHSNNRWKIDEFEADTGRP